MPIPVVDISSTERDKILALHEGHFLDFKAAVIAPAKLTRTIAALSNAEGGDVYIGVSQQRTNGVNTWAGFSDPESANGHLQAFEALFPLGDGYSYTFLRPPKTDGLVLKIEIHKSRDVKLASDGKVYI